MPDAGKCPRIVVGFNTDAPLYFATLVDKVELHGGVLLLGGYMPVARARAYTPHAQNLNELSNRSIGVLHTNRQHKNDDMVLFTPSSFRTSVLWGDLLCSLHSLKVVVSCEAAEAASASDLRRVITSEADLREGGQREDSSHLRLSSFDAHASERYPVPHVQCEFPLGRNSAAEQSGISSP
jgi:hypothetical protein